MIVFIEGEKYPKGLLLEVFDDSKFYVLSENFGRITSVGYCFSFDRKTITYVLPKVFLTEIYRALRVDKITLVNYFENSIKHNIEYLWFRKLIVFFFKSIHEYKKRTHLSALVSSSDYQVIDSNVGNSEYSYLELIFTFEEFYKKNKDFMLYEYRKTTSKVASKLNWSRTVRKSLPLISNQKKPFYETYQTKKKGKSNEELISIFFSILSSFNSEFDLGIRIDPSINIYKSNRFLRLQREGERKLKRIRNAYYNDTLKKMYRLCLVYFQKTDQSSTKYGGQEYFSIANYNIVFEDMLDKVLSVNECDKSGETNGVSLSRLKKHDDGKIIDHFYNYNSLIEKKDVYYIGDSKYYKPDDSAGGLSMYKQFTYAKNIIQFHIDLLNTGTRNPLIVRYRDKITEGYEISPNFFIYGAVDELENFDSPLIEKKGGVHHSYHFKDRLFDRDSLFVHQYKINFLFVLKAYSRKNMRSLRDIRRMIKGLFRENFIEFFNNENACGFTFFYDQGSVDKHEDIIAKDFRSLVGKTYRTEDHKLIFAKHVEDDVEYEIESLLSKFCFT